MTRGYSTSCVVDGCDRRATRRHLCLMHYSAEKRAGRLEQFEVYGPKDAWKNPLVCVCDKPVADPARDAGMCQVCKRKPLALMAVAS